MQTGSEYVFNFSALADNTVIDTISVTVRAVSAPALIVIRGHGTHSNSDPIELSIEKIIDFGSDTVLSPSDLGNATFIWEVLSCPNKYVSPFIDWSKNFKEMFDEDGSISDSFDSRFAKLPVRLRSQI